MLVMRIDRVAGTCKVEGYQTGGWFPIDGFNFGFADAPSAQSQGENQTQQQGGANRQQSRTQSGSRRQTAPASGTAASAESKKTEFSAMTVSRNVDAATIHLMKLAMQARARPGDASPEDSPIKADIHIIGSMYIEETGANVYTQVMIHLETVHVTDWKVSGSGEGRPSETLTLQYGRAAMRYLGTPDGVLLDSPIFDGWDQWKAERWTYFTG